MRFIFLLNIHFSYFKMGMQVITYRIYIKKLVLSLLYS